ncbi:MAG: arginine deiminase [Acidimicrobiia bacterium]|nr:MAG: arginine deiminase [Acidimicrobiia bacterium]
MPSITSEIGRLRTVMVHRPGPELARLTPENRERYLFDDILWLQRAQEEHDRLVGLLEGRGVEVLQVRDLLRDVLDDPGTRGTVIDRVVTPSLVGERLSEHLRHEFRQADTERLLDALFSGVLASELSDWGLGGLFADFAADRHQAVIRPLPNMMFMRDNAAWVDGGLVFSILAWPVRRPESLIVSSVYRNHPRFRDVGFPVWYGDREFDTFPATIEGGDILVVDDTTVLIGSGERTSPAAIEAIAGRLFEARAAERVIVARFPRERSFMHLDTVITLVDRDAVNVFPGILTEMQVFRVEPGPMGGLQVSETDGLLAEIEAALGTHLRVITTGGDAVGQAREQWDDGNNTLAVEPGVVIAYARNVETNKRLREAGIEVLELDSSELCRGRGGSRCLTQPVERDPV